MLNPSDLIERVTLLLFLRRRDELDAVSFASSPADAFGGAK
jgi:hypothetical protein